MIRIREEAMNRSCWKTVIFFILVPAIFTATGAWGLSEAETQSKRDKAANFKYKTVQTKEGLVFRVPEDMPIETRDGIQAPIPFDEYVYDKFKAMDSRLRNIESKLMKIEELLITLQKKESQK